MAAHYVQVCVLTMKPDSSNDIVWMSLALQLAEQGLNTTMPNPRVGCVLVKEGQLIGRGAHLKAGEPHAEVFAIREAGGQATGATAYVTLEPCSHTGRTPPCANALIEAGVARVVVAMQDPNPLVSGAGIARLRSAGIEVLVGVLATQAESLNPGFIARMKGNRPFVRSKVAASLDGQTALANGISQWITSEDARADVQRWRARSCAMLTGIGTVLADDPQLRLKTEMYGRQPIRVIVDSQLQIPLTSKILGQGDVILAHVLQDEARQKALEDQGVRLWHLPDPEHHRVDLKALMQRLGAYGINEVMVEAGASLNGALLQHRLIDECIVYLAPKWMGSSGRGLFDLPAFERMSQAIELAILDVRMVGPDLRMIVQPQWTPSAERT